MLVYLSWAHTSWDLACADLLRAKALLSMVLSRPSRSVPLIHQEMPAYLEMKEQLMS